MKYIRSSCFFVLLTLPLLGLGRDDVKDRNRAGSAFDGLTVSPVWALDDSAVYFQENDGIIRIDTPTGNKTKVLADDCAAADALATAFLISGVDQALKLSDRLDQVEVLFVNKCSDGSLILHQSKGWPSPETICKKESER